VYLLQIFLAAVVLGIGAGSAALPAVPTIFIAGDSTAAPGTPAAIQGWGTPFADFFDATKVSVVNGARGGRSSRTFITDGSWEQIISRVKAGDIVLIQFGHNDGGAINEEPPGSTRPLRARGSLPGLGDESREIDNVLTGQHEVVHTYGWYMRRMIADVKAKGATPVLLSLTPRNYWTNGRIERGNGQYGAWTREIARTERVAFVDLTNFAADALEVMGEDETSKLFEPDRTHSNQAGAEFNAAGVVAGLKALRTVAVAPYLSAKGTGVAAAPASRIVDRVPALYLIGDSTVRNGQGDGANGQWGWGEPLVDHFDATKISVLNRAVGGLSSRTFLTLGHWERVLAVLQPGDFVVMQFGHNDAGALNDEPPGPLRARGTIRGIGEETKEIDNVMTKQHEVVHTYGWYLRRFVADTRAKGATPIICSLIPRKIWGADGRIARNTYDYAGWARQVAEAGGVAFIDLNEIIAKRYDELGRDAVTQLFPQVVPDEHTHTNRAGAELNATIVVAGLKALPGNPFAGYVARR
jgi:lysophospholipase L1-like esterase